MADRKPFLLRLDPAVLRGPAALGRRRPAQPERADRVPAAPRAPGRGADGIAGGGHEGPGPGRALGRVQHRGRLEVGSRLDVAHAPLRRPAPDPPPGPGRPGRGSRARRSHPAMARGRGHASRLPQGLGRRRRRSGARGLRGPGHARPGTGGPSRRGRDRGRRHRRPHRGLPPRTRRACRCAIFEAQNRIGGRMFSLRGHFPDGQVVELGGELIDTGHARIRALADELGIALDDLAQADERAWRTTPGSSAAAPHGGGGRRGVPCRSPRASRPTWPPSAATARHLPRRRTAREALDRTVDRAVARPGRRDAAGSARCSTSPTRPSTASRSAEQSALNLLMMIDAKPEPFRIFGESDERFHVRGGNDLVRGRAGRAARRRGSRRAPRSRPSAGARTAGYA